MDEQGGAGGVPLEGEGKQGGRRKAHADRRTDRTAPATTPAADTDEASRLDRPQQPEKASAKSSEKASGTRWVGPREE